MKNRMRTGFLLLSLTIFFSSLGKAQDVPLGINYQAVARDNYGKELADREIDVRFSIIRGNPLGELAYQELHSKARTSKYGVFSLVIGKGTVTGGLADNLSYIDWGSANHYIKVEVKFENSGNFIDMGTMQFLAVPYALYAEKSLYPGPQGPQGVKGEKGDKGDPATDDQSLSFDGTNLSISGGNTINLSTLSVPHQLSILGDTLSILGGNKVLLPDDIQDLQIDFNNKLKITRNPAASEINLSKYLQTVSFNTANSNLSISDGNTIDLSSLKNDADANPANELQSLNYDKNSGSLSISSGNSVSINNTVGYKARKVTSQTGLTLGTTYPFINSEVEFNEGSNYNSGSGSFTAPVPGIYTFFITYRADGTGSGRVFSLLLNGNLYEILGPDISAGTELSRWVTMKLNQGDEISLTINTGMSTYSGTGSFVGYRVN